MKTYIADRESSGTNIQIWDDGTYCGYLLLDPSQSIRYYSSDFDWGYPGQGPAQLSLALLYDVFCDQKIALFFHLDFQHEVISRFENNGFRITEEDIWNVVDGVRLHIIFNGPEELKECAFETLIDKQKASCLDLRLIIRSAPPEKWKSRAAKLLLSHPDATDDDRLLANEYKEEEAQNE